MKSMTQFLAVSTLLVITTIGFATTTPMANQGLYIGGDIGMGSLNCSGCNVNITGTTATTSSSSTNGTPLTIFGGYQFNANLAVEVGGGSAGSIKSTYSINTGAESVTKGEESFDTTHIYLAIKGMLPLDNQWGLFGKLGYDTMQASSPTHVKIGNPAGIYAAAGASFNFNAKLAATLSYNQILDSAETNINVVYGALGLTYLF